MMFVAVFELFVGVLIAGLWTALLATRRVPELQEGRRDIGFHITAELLTAGLLIAGGVRLIVDGGPRAVTLAATALGALLYTTLNSPGHYAQRREWGPAFALLGLAAVSVAALLVLLGEAG